MSRVSIVRLELHPEAKQQVVQVADRLGMTQIAVLSRLTEWFATEEQAVQAAVLSQQGDAARAVIARKAGEKRRPAV